MDQTTQTILLDLSTLLFLAGLIKGPQLIPPEETG
jgi:hypothetical protein